LNTEISQQIKQLLKLKDTAIINSNNCLWAFRACWLADRWRKYLGKLVNYFVSVN